MNAHDRQIAVINAHKAGREIEFRIRDSGDNSNAQWKKAGAFQLGIDPENPKFDFRTWEYQEASSSSESTDAESYKILTGHSAADIASEINLAMKWGWVTTGGIFIINDKGADIWHQAMFRESAP